MKKMQQQNKMVSFQYGAHAKKKPFCSAVVIKKTKRNQCNDVTENENEKKIETFLHSFRFERAGRILAMGCGGSASDSEHFCTELGARYFLERPGIKNMLLCPSPALGTALINDYNPDNIFARQIETEAGPNDTLVAFTTSGNSKSIYNGIIAGLKHCHQILLINGKGGGLCHQLALQNQSKIKEL